jgi:hypothetical protein
MNDYSPFLKQGKLVVGDSVQFLTKRQALKATHRDPVTADIYVVRKVVEVNGVGKYLLTRDRDGKNVARRVSRSELYLAMFLVFENGHVVPGREEWA